MRNEALNYKHVFEESHPVQRLIAKVAESNLLTQSPSRKRRSTPKDHTEWDSWSPAST